MELQHVNVKIFVEESDRVEQEAFTSIFQKWIQDRVCEELLIDVADYLHVDAGPGIVLIGHEADYSMDETGHRLGLRYNRKTELAGDNQSRFSQALKAALQACLRLETEDRLAGKLKFNRREIELFINDRGFAPNTRETQAQHGRELELFFLKVFRPQTIGMNFHQDPRERFGVTVKSQHDIDFQAVLQNL
jgi:hypothetical protein